MAHEGMDGGVDVRPVTPEARRVALAEVERLVDSRDFRGSDRLRRLLRHLVEQTLSGNERRLNQRQLAEDVFARTVAFDPEQDAIVRVEVGKLRRSLADYYRRAGREHRVRIEVPRGSYVPRFHWEHSGAAAAPADSPAVPAIAVAPFRSAAEDPTSAMLASGITEEFSAALGRIPYLRLVSGWSSDRDAGLPEVLDELRDTRGLRFLVEGSVQFSGSRARVFVRLHDAMRLEEIWAERFDYAIGDGDILDSQEDISALLSGHLADVYVGVINRTLIGELRGGDSTMGPVHEAILRFSHYFTSHSDGAYLAARRALEEALRLEPDNPLVMALTADIRRAGYSLGYTDEPDPLVDVLRMSRRAVGLSPRSPACRLSLCYALLQARDRGPLLETAKPLLEDPSLTPGYRGDVALAIALAGEWETGCEILRSLVQPLGNTPHAFFYPLVLDSYRVGDYARAWELTHQFPPSSLFWQPMLKAAILGQLGRSREAEQAATEVLASRPKFPGLGRRFMSCFLFEDSLVEHLVEGLEKAGLGVR